MSEYDTMLLSSRHLDGRNCTGEIFFLIIIIVNNNKHKIKKTHPSDN